MTTTITGLPAGTTPTGTEVVPADQSGGTVKLTLAQIYAYVASALGITLPLSIANGGTGATTAPLARTALGALGSTESPGAPYVDTNPVVKGSVDATKQLRFEVDGYTAATTRVMTTPDADTKLGPAVIAVGRNIAARTNSATPNSKIDITADELLLKDSNSLAFLASTVSVTIDMATSGANGLDTGAEAGNTWYYGWVIAKTDGTVAGLASASATAPTMPSGYTFKALATAVRNDGSSNFIKYRQQGATAWYEAKQSILAAGTATAETAVATSTFVPPVAELAVLYCYLNMNSTAGGFASGTGTLRIVSGSNFYALEAIGNFASDAGRDTAQVSMPNISQNVYYIMSSVGSINSNALTLDVMGYGLPVGGQ